MEQKDESSYPSNVWELNRRHAIKSCALNYELSYKRERKKSGRESKEETEREQRGWHGTKVDIYPPNTCDN